MHRIDDYGAAGGMFTEGDPGQAIPATKITDDWLNDIQENVTRFIEAAGITLVKGTYTQLAAAVAAYIATHNALTNPHSATNAAAASRLVLRDASGRAQFADPVAAQDAATMNYVDARAVKAWALVGSDGSISGANGITCNKLATGQYRLNFTAPSGNYAVALTRNNSAGRGFIEEGIHGATQVTVYTYNSSGAAADANFSVMLSW